MKTLLLDSEEGYLSVSDLVEKGTVDRRPVSRFADLESVYMGLLNKEITADVVVIDSLSAVARFTRQDITIDPKDLKAGTLWSNRQRLVSSQRNWGEMSDLIGRLLANFRSLPIPLIVVCHEKEAVDEETNTVMRGPALNPMLLDDLIMNSDVLARLALSNTSTQLDGTTYPPRTRFLRLQPTSDLRAKNRAVVGATVPELIPEPTLTALAEVFNGLPKKIVLYGLPGVGKTVLACSLSRTTK